MDKVANRITKVVESLTEGLTINGTLTTVQEIRPLFPIIFGIRDMSGKHPNSIDIVLNFTEVEKPMGDPIYKWFYDRRGKVIEGSLHKNTGGLEASPQSMTVNLESEKDKVRITARGEKTGEKRYSLTFSNTQAQ